jgi:hypothetical protein
VDEQAAAREYCTIGMSGDAEMLIVCEDFTVEESDLAERYPEVP